MKANKTIGIFCLRYTCLNRFALFIQCTVIGCWAVAMSGCGDGRPARVPITGRVTIEGQSLNYGSISFKPKAGGRAGGGAIEEGGVFSITMYTVNDGLPPGKYDVAISAIQPIDEDSQRWLAPQRYADFKTSGLFADINEEGNPLEFDLSWKGDRHSAPWVEEF